MINNIIYKETVRNFWFFSFLFFYSIIFILSEIKERSHFLLNIKNVIIRKKKPKNYEYLIVEIFIQFLMMIFLLFKGNKNQLASNFLSRSIYLFIYLIFSRRNQEIMSFNKTSKSLYYQHCISYTRVYYFLIINY